MKNLVLLLIVIVTTVAATTTSPCDQLKLAASYDVIIVGTGLGGSVAARRLAEWNPNWNILVIERGESYANCTSCSQAYLGASATLDLGNGPFLNTTAQRGLNGVRVSYKDPAVQGGGTSVNGELHVRGDAVRLFEDYFPPNWTPYSMIQFYERYENYTFPPGFHKTPWTYADNLRGSSGPVVASQQGPTQFNTKYLQALQKVFPNMPVYYNTSINDGYMPGIGASYIESTTVGSKRVSAYTAYIQSYSGGNLKAIYGTLTTKVLFDSSAQVTGVQLVLTRARAQELGLGNQTLAQCVVSSNKVIVSAGALGTPKVLKLSGVGPAAELNALGIPVVSDVCGVGNNLRDHFTLVTFIGPKSSSTRVPFVTNATNNIGWAFFNANGTKGVPNDFIYGVQSFSNTSVVFTSAGSNLLSSGTVKLASTDPTVPAIVDPNYFGNPADRYGVGLATMKSFNVSEAWGFNQLVNPCSVYPCQTPSQTLDAFVKFNLFAPGYHYSATAALCNVTNPVSLRVKGTRGLYVLDASIMPYSPPSNVQSTVYAVSERGIDMINANMHSTYALQDIDEDAGWFICQFAPNVAAIQ